MGSQGPKFQANIEDRSDCADGQTDLSNCGTHNTFVGFVLLGSNF